MKAREILKRIEALGGAQVRQKGSHIQIRCACGAYRTTVQQWGSKDLPRGTVGSIEKDLAPCAAFRKGWLWQP